MKRKCIASFCKEIPYEILAAASMDVIKIADILDNVGESGKYLSNNLCSYSKNALDYLLCKSDLFEGMIFTNSCHAMESMYEICHNLFDDKFVYMLDVPRIRTPKSVDYFQQVLIAFKNEISNYFNIDIKDDVIAEQHSLMCDIYKQRVGLIDKSKKNVLVYSTNYTPFDLQQVLSQFGDYNIMTELLPDYEERLLSTPNIMERIAYFYLQNKFSSTNYNIDAVTESIVAFVKKNDIYLVIIPVIKFCSDQVFISAALQQKLKKDNIKSILINTEYCKFTSGQILTRIEATIENMP